MTEHGNPHRRRIAFFGNTNCMPFRHALTLKEMGHDVVFHVDARAEDRLHRPETLFDEIEYPYPNWIIELGWQPRGIDFLLPRGRLRRLIQELNREHWDGIVLCGGWLKLANHIRQKTALLALLAGSDLDVLGSYRQSIRPEYSGRTIMNGVTMLAKLTSTYMQRSGIRKCTLINYYPKGVNPRGDQLLDGIMRGRSFERLHFRGCDVKRIQWIEPSTRVNDEVRLFSPTRFIWKEPLPTGYTTEENKGNDFMLRGIAKYYAKSGIPVRLDLIEKGVHVNEAKELAAELGIDHLITWHKEVSHREILQWYAASDIILDQFGNHWIGTGAVDSMLMGRPVIGKARNDVFLGVLNEKSPMCDVESEEDIAAWLEVLVSDSDKRREIGLESRAFMLKHFDSENTALALLNHINQSACADR